MKEDGWEGVFERRGFEEEDVAVWKEASDDLGARGSIDGEAQVSDGDFAVVADLDI